MLEAGQDRQDLELCHFTSSPIGKRSEVLRLSTVFEWALTHNCQDRTQALVSRAASEKMQSRLLSLRAVTASASRSQRALSSLPAPSRRPRPPGPTRFRASFQSTPPSATVQRVLYAAAGLSGAYVLFHLDRAPTTGRVRMIDMSRATELEVGATAFAQLLRTAPASHPREAAAARVARVGRRLAAAAATEYPALVHDMDWRFVLLRAPGDANAVCCPGGRVAVFSGLLDVARDDDALAAVLAHEIAHAVARHRCVLPAL